MIRGLTLFVLLANHFGKDIFNGKIVCYNEGNKSGFAEVITMLRLIFEQTDKYSYRDPAAFIKDGVIYLFFTLVENAEDGQYFYVAESTSTDFVHFSEPVILTEKDKSKNYSSPGNVVEYNGCYYLCLQTYPRPNGEKYG